MYTLQGYILDCLLCTIYHVSNVLCTLYRATVLDCLLCTKISSFKRSIYAVQGYRTGLPSMFQDIMFHMIYVHCTGLPYWTSFYVPRYHVSNNLCTLYRATVLDCLLYTKISSFKWSMYTVQGYRAWLPCMYQDTSFKWSMFTVQGYRTGLPSMYQDIMFQMIYVHCTGLPYMPALYVPRYQVLNGLCTLYRATVLDCLLFTKISSFKWSMYTVHGYRTGLPSLYQDIKFQIIYVHCTGLPYMTALYVPRYQVSNDLCSL